MIMQVEQDRKRHIMQQVIRRVGYWQQIWMCTETPSSYAKGRYLAAKAFYDWLGNGGTVEGAQAYLNQMKESAHKVANSWEIHKINAELNKALEAARKRNERIAELNLGPREWLSPEQKRELGLLMMEAQFGFTEEEITSKFSHAYTPNFTLSKDEELAVEAQSVQARAGDVEARHLERLLKEESPLKARLRAVIDTREYEDENDIPD